ncbi:MAG: PAS domain S-box protein [Terrimonas sp.]|nr:PAS domain S-box protein [Terrimonas sp.]
MSRQKIISTISAWFIRRPILSGCIAFLLLALLSTLLIYQRYRLLDASDQRDTRNVLEATRNQLQQSIDNSLTATLALSFIINNEGKPENFDSAAAVIMRNNQYFDMLELVPDGVIKYIYPLKGNEVALGYNILADTTRNEEARKAIETGRLFFAGPLELKQGGTAVVGRLPVYRQGKFWGFSAVVIRLAHLLEAAGIDTSGKKGYYFQLSKANTETGQEDFFLQKRDYRKSKYEAEVLIPDGQWKITATPVHKNAALSGMVMMIILGFLLSCFGAGLVYYITKKPSDLQKLIELKTAELSQSKKRNEAILNAIPDTMFVLDRAGNFIGYNNPKGNPTYTSPDLFIGRNLSEVLPPEIANASLINLEKTFASKKGVSQSYELELAGEIRQFEARFEISGNDEVLVIIRDTTEGERIQQAMLESEKKFRAIFNSSFQFTGLLTVEGKILEVNQTFLDYLQVQPEDLVGKYLWDIRFWNNEQERIERIDNLKMMLENAGRGLTVRQEVDIISTTGQIDTVDFSVKPVKNDQGEVVFLIPEGRVITELKQAEAGYRQSHQQLTRHLENSPLGVLEYTNELLVTQWSKRAEEIFGWTKQEILDQKITAFNLIYEEDLPKTNRIAKELMEGKVSGNISYNRNYTKDGSIVHCVWYNSVLFDEHLKPVSIMSLVQDVTHEKMVEAALKESELKYRTLIEQASDAIIVYEPSGRIVEFNEIALKYTGYRKEEIKKLNIADFLFQEDLHKKPLQFSELKRGKPVTDHRRIRRQDGSDLIVELNSKLLHNGNIIAIARDITYRKITEERLAASERKLRQVLSSTTDNFYVIDTNYTVILINETAERNLQLAWGKPVTVGTNILEVIPENGHEPIRESFIQVLDGKAIEYEINNEIHNLPEWVLVSMTPVIDEEGIVSGAYVVAKDISERKNAERELFQAKERYERIAVATNDALWEYDILTGKIWWNLRHYQFYGHNPDLPPLSQDEWEKRIFPEHTQQVIDSFNKAIHSGELLWTCEYKFLMPNHHYAYVNDRVFFYYDHNGDLIKMIGSMSDINEKKKSEEKLIESEAKYRSLVDQAGDAIVLLDKNGKILEVNKSAAALLGYSIYEMENMSLIHILAEKEMEAGTQDFYLPEKGEVVIERSILLKKNGDTIETEINTKVLPDGRYLFIIRDLSERIRAQKQIEKEKELSDSIINSLPGIFYFFDHTGKFLRWNKRFEDVSGFTGPEIAKMHPLDFFQGPDKSVIASRIQIALEKGISDAEANFTNKNGETIPYFLTGASINNDGVMCVLGMGIDITDRKRAEQELNHSFQEVRRLSNYLHDVREEERTHIAREIHDELGQQLTVLKMDISWIHKRMVTDDPVVREKLQSLLQLVDTTVKTVRKISSELRPSMLDDLGLIAALEWHSQEFEKRFLIRVQFDADVQDILLPPKISNGIFRIYQESLTNIARHAEATEVKAKISYQDAVFTLTIADNGKGFFKAAIENKKTLGILGMRERVKMLEGDFEITSLKGKGTIVKVAIPLKQHINELKR